VETLLANRPLDQSDGGVECLVYIEFAGVEQQGICRHFHRCVGAAGVTFVAAADHGQNALVSHILAAGGHRVEETPAGHLVRDASADTALLRI